MKSKRALYVLGAVVAFSSVWIRVFAPDLAMGAEGKAPAVIKGDLNSTLMGVMELERLDKRKPVPLSPMMANHQKQNMREHLEAVQGIVSSLSRDDFAGVEKAAKTMGYSEEMKQMCTHMGAGAPGFTDTAINFHKTADTIAEAARFKNRAAVLQALDATLKTCTGCHVQFRQQIVDEGSNGQHTKRHGG
jgi:hypothetical protein